MEPENKQTKTYTHKNTHTHAHTHTHSAMYCSLELMTDFYSFPIIRLFFSISADLCVMQYTFFSFFFIY